MQTNNHLERDLNKKYIFPFSYPGVDVKDFTNSWKDGLAFNALINKFRPSLFNYNELYKKRNMSSNAKFAESNLEHAFALAQEHLHIERLLDIEDVITDYPDKKSIMMYVMCYFQVLSKPQSTLIEDNQKESSKVCLAFIFRYSLINVDFIQVIDLFRGFIFEKI